MSTLSDNIKKMVSSPDSINYIVFYLVLFAFILVLPFFLSNVSSGLNVDSKYYYGLYVTIFTIAIVACLLILTRDQRYIKSLFGLMFFVLFMIGILCFFTNRSFTGDVSNTSMNIILGITLGLVVFVALAMFYKIFSNMLESQTGWINFIIQFIFFIPCIINEVVDYVLDQYKNTPSSVFVLFIIEILLLICYCLIPVISGAVLNTKGNNILLNPVYLKNKQILVSGEELTYLEKNDPVSDSETKIPLSSYAISMWIYMNQHDHLLEKGSYKNIFTYTNSDNTEAKPQILYYNDRDSEKRSKNVYKIIFQGSNTSKNTSYQIDLPGQKWNHLFFNYRNGANVELYLNGVLERNFELKYKPRYSMGDTMIVGDENGLDGSICNITYYSEPLSKFQIANTYNLYMSRNPPTP
jgi:hypothetical protein